MRCATVREKFVDYLDGDARRTERLCVEVHVARCYPCREELEETRELLATYGDAMRHPNPQNDFGRVRTRIAQLQEKSQEMARPHGMHRRRPWPKLVVSAAALVLMAVSLPFVLNGVHWMKPSQDGHDGVGERAKAPAASRPFVERKNQIDLKLSPPFHSESGAAVIEASL